MPIVSLKNVNKSFKDKVVLKDFSIDVEEGEFTQRIMPMDGRAFYKPKKK